MPMVKKPKQKPPGKVSSEKLEGYIPRKTWYFYVGECKEWAKKNDRDLKMEELRGRDTRGTPQRYYDAQVFLDWWTSEKKHLPYERYTRLRRRFKTIAEET